MKPSNRRGAAAIEFAFAVVVVFLFVFGVIEFGRVRMVQHTIDNASYEAARHVVVPGGTAAEAIDAAQAILDAGRISDATISVSPNPIRHDATSVRVHISAPLSSNAWVAPKFTAGRIVESETELMTERAPAILVGTTPTRPMPTSGPGTAAETTSTPTDGGDGGGGDDGGGTDAGGGDGGEPAPPPPFSV